MQPVIPDFWELTWAFLLFPLILVVPGYVVAYLSGLFKETGKTLHWSVGLLVSISICPVVLYVLMRFIGATAAWGVLGVAWFIFAYLLYRERDGFREQIMKPLKQPGSIGLFIIYYVVIAFLLIDFQIDGHLMRPLMSYDFVKHVTVTDAISRTAIPPVNPSFHPGEPMPLFYYYFWFLLCSMVDQIGGDIVGPRGAVLASITWSGIALFYLLRLYLHRLGSRIVRGFERAHVKYGYLLLLITGVDMLPAAYVMFMRSQNPLVRVLPDSMWWNDQVASWFSSFLWTPHHVGGFIACMLAFYLVLERKPMNTRSGKIAMGVIALTFVSALGMSIWVTLVGGLALIIWTILAYTKGWREEALFLVITGVLSIALALPYVIDLYQANHFFRPSIAFQIRAFTPINSVFSNATPILTNVANLLVLPLNYLLEFGFFAFGGLLYWEYRRRLQEKLDRYELFMMVLMATSFFVCTFFRSALFNNDLGWRGFLFAQFVLLLFSIPLMVSLRGKMTDERFTVLPLIRGLAIGSIVLSIVWILFQCYVVRSYFWGPKDELTMMVREAYEWQDEHLPVDAVIQHDPDIELFPGDQTEYFHSLYGNRQVAVADRLYSRAYGINDAMFDSSFTKVRRLFLQDLTPEEGAELAARLNIDGVFIKHTDLIWDDSTSWLTPFDPVYESTCCRIYLTNAMK